MKLLPIYDAVINDSDKSWTVPRGKTWELLWAHAELISTATVGNRHIWLEIRNAESNVVSQHYAGALQAASLTRHYEFMQGIFRETAFVVDAINVAYPKDTILLEGWSIRIYDSGAIDAAADDMTISFMVKERAQ